MTVVRHEWKFARKLSELSEGEVVGIELDGMKIALYNLNGKIHATDNVCTHASAILSNGWLEDGVIECPLHGGRFEVCTGRALGPPVEQDLNIYEVRIVGDNIEVRIPLHDEHIKSDCESSSNQLLNKMEA